MYLLRLTVQSNNKLKMFVHKKKKNIKFASGKNQLLSILNINFCYQLSGPEHSWSVITVRKSMR